MAHTTKINKSARAFMEAQRVFFVGTAATHGSVNISPKGMDSLRIKDERTVRWLNLTGSGNETAAHVAENGRMVLMFCAFEGDARIMRLHGTARVMHPRDRDWKEALSDFPAMAGSRQIFELAVERVSLSCGTGVPIMEFQRSRGEEELLPFYADMGEDGVRDYWSRKNAQTIDGTPTHIFGAENDLG